MKASAKRWPKDAGEISGFGGGYEECCQAMFEAGIAWLEAHPTAEPKFQVYAGIYGVVSEANADAKELTKAVIDAAESKGGATGAMHQAVIGHLVYIRANGFAKWRDELVIKREAK